MMARIMGTAQNALPSAQLLGTAFQRINFLRDIEEDRERGRIYLPLSLLKEHGISEKEWLQKKPRDERYKKLVVAEAAAIRAMWPTIWAGLRTLSPRCRLAVGLSCKGYFATLGKIEEEPLLPFQKPLRMRKLWLFRLLLTTLSRITRAHVPK